MKAPIIRIRLAMIAPLMAIILAACATTPPSASSPGLTVASLSRSGPHEIRAYTSAPVPEAYARATIYYPMETDALISGVSIAPGYTQSQRHINWWGSRLATHGYAVLVLDTNTPEDGPEARAAALEAGIEVLREEGGREGSPLHGRIDARRMAVMGHSMGGGGALAAAQDNSARLAAAIPFTPWFPDGDFSNMEVPTMIIAAAADRIAPVDEHAWPFFQSLPEQTPRAYLEIADGNHFIGNNMSPQWHPLLGRYAIAWLKIHMDGDERYRRFIEGDIAENDAEHFFSRYITRP